MDHCYQPDYYIIMIKVFKFLYCYCMYLMQAGEVVDQIKSTFSHTLILLSIKIHC